MDLNELLEVEGVESLDALRAKLQKQGEQKAAGELEKKNKQIEDLERIKSEQGNELGDLRKENENLKSAKPAEKQEEKQTDNAPASEGKTSEQWAQECKEKEAVLTDAEYAKLEEAYKDLDPEVRKLVTQDGEGRLALINNVLESGVQPEQETFRRPTPKRQLTITEQVQQGLGTLKPKTAPRPQTSGVATSSQSNVKPAASIPVPIKMTGSLLEAINASKQ